MIVTAKGWKQTLRALLFVGLMFYLSTGYTDQTAAFLMFPGIPIWICSLEVIVIAIKANK